MNGNLVICTLALGLSLAASGCAESASDRCNSACDSIPALCAQIDACPGYDGQAPDCTSSPEIAVSDCRTNCANTGEDGQNTIAGIIEGIASDVAEQCDGDSLPACAGEVCSTLRGDECCAGAECMSVEGGGQRCTPIASE